MADNKQVEFLLVKNKNRQKLINKAAIVTGASNGVGAAIALAYGTEGASVVANYSPDKAGAERVAN